MSGASEQHPLSLFMTLTLSPGGSLMKVLVLSLTIPALVTMAPSAAIRSW